MSGYLVNGFPFNNQVRKTIRGGHGSVYIKGGGEGLRSSSVSMSQDNINLDYVNSLMHGSPDKNSAAGVSQSFQESPFRGTAPSTNN